MVDPSADCGERRERRRPHRHLENEAQRLLPFFTDELGSLPADPKSFSFPLVLPRSTETAFYKLFYLFIQVQVIHWAAMLTCSDDFLHLGKVLRFLCDFHSLWLLGFSMQPHMGLKQTVTGKGHVAFMKQTKKLLLYVFSTVLLFHVNCVDAATIFCDILHVNTLSLFFCFSRFFW